jgi:hypothetical protein
VSKSKHTEAQMIEALKQMETGRTAAEVGRQYGVTQHTKIGYQLLQPRILLTQLSIQFIRRRKSN